MSTMRQRNLFEVYGLARSSDEDTITVAHRPSKAKRKRGDVDADNDRKRKVAKTRSAPKPKQKPPVIDLSSDDENITLARPKRSPRSTATHADTASSDQRVVLGELSTAQYQNQLKGPVAWYKPPAFKTSFLKQFSATPSATPSRASASPSGTPTSTGRSRRAVGTRRSYVSLVSSSDVSEDELSRDFRVPSRKPASKATINRKKKPVPARDHDDSDFMDDAPPSDDYEESEVVIDDSSSIQPSESDEDASLKKSKPKQTKATKNPAAKAKSSSITKPKSSSKNMANLLKTTKGSQGLDLSLAPMSDIRDIFSDMTSKALDMGFKKAVQHMEQSRPLRVATMCSGTESPLLALEMIKNSLCSGSFQVEHLFSAELVAFKQAYIERNFNPPIIFRDITELIGAFETEEQPTATTAYGAKVPVPTDLDMLIAGTSCVDYSGMNSRKKGIHDGGESGDTWSAVLDFCKVSRPAMVLIENVKGAPWDAMLEQYQEIGYESAGALVNTKDYYIPHIRQRGYMACFDQTKLRAADLSKVASHWASLMERFKRPASSPVSSFLLPNDRIARQQFRTDEPTREVDWSQCEITQMQYRQQKRLGNARPITHWSESGSMLVPDNGHAQWYQNQVERVLDTIDAAHLRKALPANDMYDNRFKTRVVDLSQNVHREQDHRAFGIVGCITPSGMFFISDAGRQLTSEETLKLQGLPLDRISFTTESPADVQDLAGNAMSTTVIGSSILSALIVGHKMISGSPAVKSLPVCETRSVRPQLQTGRVSSLVFNSGSRSTALPDILSRAARSLRMCYCEGSRGLTQKAIQQCQDCSHTTCVACGGNPAHNYRQSPLLGSARLAPGLFEQELRSSLPLRLIICQDGAAIRGPLDIVDNTQYREMLSHVMTQTFSFAGIRRTHCWTVTYQANGARLDLVVESEAVAEWRLFACVSEDLPANDGLRTMLEQPVARSQVKQDFFGDTWQVRIPQQTVQPTVITGSGNKLPSWWARNAMPDFKDHFVWETLTIQADGNFQALNGVYQHLPHCGTACNSLYKRSNDQQTEPLYLFLDPTRTGDPKEDCFVFSRNHAVLEYDEVRPVIARLHASWRAWSTDPKKSGISTATKSKLVADDTWEPLPAAIRLSPAPTNLVIEVPEQGPRLLESLECTTAAALVSCKFPSEEQTKQPEEPGFFEKSAWLFEAMRRHIPSDQWFDLHGNCVDYECARCSPPRPELRWALSETGNIVPHEDPSTAAAYERAMKSRPQPLFAAVTLSRGDRRLDVGLNLTSLAHRAGARLRQQWDMSSTVSYSWRFTTATSQASFTFKPFRLSSTSGVEPCSGGFGLTVNLFPKQRLALSWMLQQEDGVPFMLEEIEEASIPSLGWRAEVKAETPVIVRGGICADHPGFGKTILSLALIASEWKTKGSSGIVSDLQSRQSAVPGLIPLAATLIICPSALLKQWQSEIAEKVEDDCRVVVINTLADLAKQKMTDFEHATIILVNRTVFGNEAYAERLAAFSGMPGPATKSGRAFAHWLKSVTERVPEHLKILDRGFGLKDLQRHIKAVYKKNMDSEEFKMNVPSRRLRGKDYVATKDRSKSSVETKAAASDIDVSQIGKPLFEMYYFNRIMIDEFHQYEGKERAAISALKADKRWGLSATPAMDDFFDVAQTASLLGVPLRTSSGARGVMKTKNARELKKEMTSFELFDMMREMPSDSIHAHIHAADQRFLDTFVRRNIMDFNDQLVYHEHLVPVELDVRHMALYAEISEHLNSLDMRIRKGTKAKSIGTDRLERLHGVIDDCTTAEEALSKSAAFLDSEEGELSDVVSLRHNQIEELLERLPGALSVSKSNEAEAFADWKESRLDSDVLGDRDTVLEISKLLRSVSTVPKTAGKKSKKSGAQTDDDCDGEGGKRKFTARLNDMCTRLLKAKRSARYLQNVSRILSAKVQGENALNETCDNPGCLNHTKDTNVEEIGVSVRCGHVICHHCYKRMKREGSSTCPADGCSESMHDIHLLWSAKMGDSTKPATTSGAKAGAAIDLLGQIAEQKDQAILFVQYQEQLEAIGNALEEAGIAALVVNNARDAGDRIEKFCSSAGTSKQITVLVLNASDETAAGLNLQNANHVIFLSPLLRDTQYGYESTMAQAIGRVRRYGQKKEIHVHRIFALNTIDVDILEHRERRNNALTQQGAPATVPLQAAKDLDQERLEKKEKMQLVQENGHFSLRPQSWLVKCGADTHPDEIEKVKGKNRVLGWQDFSSLVKFSKTFTEDDDW